MPLYKYDEETVLTEADMFLSGMKLKDISRKLKIPVSTISWHLIHPLHDVNFDTWIQVRAQLDKFAKDKTRIHRQELITEGGC